MRADRKGVDLTSKGLWPSMRSTTCPQRRRMCKILQTLHPQTESRNWSLFLSTILLGDTALTVSSFILAMNQGLTSFKTYHSVSINRKLILEESISTSKYEEKIKIIPCLYQGCSLNLTFVCFSSEFCDDLDRVGNSVLSFKFFFMC